MRALHRAVLLVVMSLALAMAWACSSFDASEDDQPSVTEIRAEIRVENRFGVLEESAESEIVVVEIVAREIDRYSELPRCRHGAVIDFEIFVEKLNA